MVFLAISPHAKALQELMKRFLIKTKDAPITQEILRDLGALSQKPRSKAKYKTKHAPRSPYHLGNYKRVLGTVCQNQGQRPVCRFSVISQTPEGWSRTQLSHLLTDCDLGPASVSPHSLGSADLPPNSLAKLKLVHCKLLFLFRPLLLFGH